jgi:predicted transcriptional regulator
VSWSRPCWRSSGTSAGAFRYTPRQSRAAMTAELMHDALDGTRADRESALVSFVGEASAEDVAALRRALADLG